MEEKYTKGALKSEGGEMGRQQISFDVTRTESKFIHVIAERAVQLAAKQGIRGIKKLDTAMDITATHANGCPLKLDELLKADDFNFAHDVFGIRRHLNRETGQLEDCFLPRFASKVPA